MPFDFTSQFPYRFCEFDLTVDQLMRQTGMAYDPVTNSFADANKKSPRPLNISAYRLGEEEELRYAAVFEKREKKAISLPVMYTGVAWEDVKSNIDNYITAYDNYLGGYQVTRFKNYIQSVFFSTVENHDYSFQKQLIQGIKASEVKQYKERLLQINGYDPNHPRPALNNFFDADMENKDSGNGVFDILIAKEGGSLPYLSESEIVVGKNASEFNHYAKKYAHGKGYQLFDVQWYVYNRQQLKFNAIWVKQEAPQWMVQYGLSRSGLQTLLTELPLYYFQPEQVAGYQLMTRQADGKLGYETQYAVRASAQLAAAFYFKKNYKGQPQLYLNNQSAVSQTDGKSTVGNPSIELAPGTGASIFYQPGYKGGFSTKIYNSNPDIRAMGQDDGESAEKIWSLRLWPSSLRPFKGGWAIKTSKGHYLNLQKNHLSQSASLGSWIRIELPENTGGDRWHVILKNYINEEVKTTSPDGKTTDYKSVEKAVFSDGKTISVLPVNRVAKSNLTLVYEGNHKFSLAYDPDNAGKWVDKDLKFTTDYQQREIFTMEFKYAARAKDMGALDVGEIAIYDQPFFNNLYGFGAVIFHKAQKNVLAELTKLDLNMRGFNLGSIMLGPQTAATFFAEGNLRGSTKMDVIADLSDTSGSQVRTLGSLKPFRLVRPKAAILESHASLSEDYRYSKKHKQLESYSAYRTTVTFPPNVRAVKVWTTDATEIEVAGKHYHVDETKHVSLSPNTQSQLVICMDAAHHGLAAPGIKLQTDTMKPGERVVIHPDEEVHARLANLNDKHREKKKGVVVPELYAAKYTQRKMTKEGLKNPQSKQLVDQSKYTADDTRNIQGAIKHLMSSVSYDKGDTTIGKTTRRKISSKQMKVQHFMLDLGVAPFAGVNKTVKLHPSAKGKTELKILNQPDAVLEDKVEHYLSGATDLGHAMAGLDLSFSSAWHKVSGAAKSAGHKIKDTAEEAGDKIKEGADEVGQDLKSIGDVVANGTKQMTHVVITTMDDAVKSVQGVIHYVEQKAEGLVQKAVKFVVNTVRKAVKLVEAIVQQIGAAIKEFVQWLQFLFEWKDILHTQEVLVDSIDNFFTYVKKEVKAAEPKVDGFFADLKSDISDVIDTIIGAPGAKSASTLLQQKGLPPKKGIDGTIEKLRGQSNQTAKNKTGGLDRNASGGMEKINWVLSKITDHKGTTAAGASPEADSTADKLTKLLTNILDRVEHDEAMKNAFSDAFAYFKKVSASGVSHAPELIIDGLLEALKGLVLAIIDIVDGLVIDFLEVIAEFIIPGIEGILNAEWNIPVISDLFELLTDSKLTTLNLFALIIAIPTTVISKLVLGRAPFKNTKALALAKFTEDEDWGITYISCVGFLGIISPVLELMSLSKSLSSGNKKKPERQHANPDLSDLLNDKADEPDDEMLIIERVQPVKMGSAVSRSSRSSFSWTRLFGTLKVLSSVGLKVATFRSLMLHGSTWDRILWSYRTFLTGWDAGLLVLKARGVDVPDPALRVVNSGLGGLHMALAITTGILGDHVFKSSDSSEGKALMFAQWIFVAAPRTSKLFGLKSMVEATDGTSILELLAVEAFDLVVVAPLQYYRTFQE